MSGRTVFTFSLVVVLASLITSAAAAQIKLVIGVGGGKADEQSRRENTPAPAEKPSECCASCAQADKMAGPWVRETPLCDITARLNDGELKICFSQCVDDASLCVTLTSDCTLTREGLIHGVFTSVDLKLNDKASHIMTSDPNTFKKLAALQTLVDCPFSFRTRMTSAGLMVSNVKLAWGDSDTKEMLIVLGGMYKQCKDGSVPLGKPRTTGFVPAELNQNIVPPGRPYAVPHPIPDTVPVPIQSLPTCPMPRVVNTGGMSSGPVPVLPTTAFVDSGTVDSDTVSSGNVFMKRTERKITLNECIALALEQGNVGIRTPTCTSSKPEILQNIQFGGGAKTQSLLGQRTEADVQINYLLANVELAYWNLYAARQSLSAHEQALCETSRRGLCNRTRVKTDSEPAGNQDQIPAHMERFRRMVIDARGQVLESERQLRGLLGLRCEDGMRLVPIDEPKVAAFVPDFQKAVLEAMANRPELIQCRQELKAQQLNLLKQRNLNKPELLDKYPGEPVLQMNAKQVEVWTVTIEPFKFPGDKGAIREAQLGLARSYIQMSDTELKVLEYLAQQYRQVIQTHADIGAARAERMALQSYIKKIETLIAIGKWNPQDFLNYLTVQQQLAAAIATESQAIADYNRALATFEFAKGTIQKYHGIGVQPTAVQTHGEMITAPAPREVSTQQSPTVRP